MAARREDDTIERFKLGLLSIVRANGGRFTALALDDASLEREVCAPGEASLVRQAFWDLMRPPPALDCHYEARATLHARFGGTGVLPERLPEDADAFLQTLTVEVRLTASGERLCGELGRRYANWRGRARVHLEVRFKTAAEFVTEYAENLSVGGLFVRGEYDVERLESVGVDLTLPGPETFSLGAQVMHIIDADDAVRLGRQPGVGLAISERPPGFTESLQAYLRKLGSRRDVSVLASEETARTLLDAAGFGTTEAVPPEDIVAAIARSDVPIIAVIVPTATADAYREALAAAGGEELLFGVDLCDELDLDPLIALLDARMPEG